MEPDVETFLRGTHYALEPLLLIGLSGEIRTANPAAHSRLAQVSGNFLDLLPLESVPAARDFLRKASGTRELVPGSFEVRFRQRGEESSPREVKCRVEAGVFAPRRAERGPLLVIRVREATEASSGFALLTQKIVELEQEITRRQALEAERAKLLASEREARERAERLNRAKDAFLATLSHELRTPINVVSGWLELLDSGSIPDSERPQIYAVMRRNVRQEIRLIDDLLDVSRFITGRMRVEMRPLEVGAALEEALEAVHFSSEAKQVKLVRTGTRSVGLVLGDADRLRQVFWNLLSNAVKFSDKGGVVEVSIGRAESMLELKVKDHGQGVDPQFLPRIFDRFSQEDDSDTRAHGGLGLGLSIARHLVELHGGSLHAHSEGKGRGATFTVRLPLCATSIGLARPEADPETFEGGGAGESNPSRDHGAAAPMPRRPQWSGALSGMSILIVDDHVASRELLAHVLAIGGAFVTEAESVDEALVKLSAGGIDVLVSDLEMPGKSGFELIEALRRSESGTGRHLPALALSAYVAAADKNKALAAGFSDHLGKPARPDELVEVLERLCHPNSNRA